MKRLKRWFFSAWDALLDVWDWIRFDIGGRSLEWLDKRSKISNSLFIMLLCLVVVHVVVPSFGLPKEIGDVAVVVFWLVFLRGALRQTADFVREKNG